MKRFKKWVMAFTVMAMLGATGAAYAATTRTPADIASDLTGKSVETLYQERSEGKTYGQIANDAGQLEAFRNQMMEQKKVILDEQVAEGRLTQDQADVMYNTMKDNQANCDGTGNARIGKNAGAGFGQGNGMGNGRGVGGGSGECNGSGMGAGRGWNK